MNSAVIEGLYRYWLVRHWDASKPLVNFIMLNPSTANAEKDDPTIRRCISFAKILNFGGFIVTNLFAFRSSSPAVLKLEIDPIGLENDSYIRLGIVRCDATIAAWGAGGAYMERSIEARRILRETRSFHAETPGSCVMLLGITNNGEPRHPLYLPAATMPQFWNLRS